VVDIVLPAAGWRSGPVTLGPAPPPATADDNESAAPVTGSRPVLGASRVAVQPDLGTTGALYSLLGIGAVTLFGATRLIRWRATGWRAVRP
jgi:hypothetical protein